MIKFSNKDETLLKELEAHIGRKIWHIKDNTIVGTPLDGVALDIRINTLQSPIAFIAHGELVFKNQDAEEDVFNKYTTLPVSYLGQYAFFNKEDLIK